MNCLDTHNVDCDGACFSAMAMVAGIVGREITRAEMRKTGDLDRFLAYLKLVGRFDGGLVRGGSTVLFDVSHAV